MTLGEFLSYNESCIREAQAGQRREKQRNRLFTVVSLLFAIAGVAGAEIFRSFWTSFCAFVAAFLLLWIRSSASGIWDSVEYKWPAAILAAAGLAIGAVFRTGLPVVVGLAAGFLMLFIRTFWSREVESTEIHARKRLAGVLNRNGTRPQPWEVQYLFPGACANCGSLRVVERHFESEQELVWRAASEASTNSTKIRKSGSEQRCESCQHEWVSYEHFEPFGPQGTLFNHSYGPVLITTSAWVRVEPVPLPRVHEIVPAEVLAELRRMWGVEVSTSSWAGGAQNGV